jgi:polar amino acid transport system substrate-binding protein
MNINRRELRSLGGTVLAAAAATVAPDTVVAQTGGSTWETIRATKLVRIGVTPSEPWYAKDLAVGTWTGAAAILGAQIARDLDARPLFVETTWANAPAALQAGQFDLMFVLDPTPARAVSIDFPFAPVLYYALGYMTRESAAPGNWAELDTQATRIAVPLGTSMDRWISQHLKQAQITRLATNDETILHYQSGRSNALVMGHPALIAYRLKIGTGQVIVPKPAVTSVAGVGIRREADKTWRDYLTSVLTFYYENGTIEDIYRAYLAGRGLDGQAVPGITKESLEHA